MLLLLLLQRMLLVLLQRLLLLLSLTADRTQADLQSGQQLVVLEGAAAVIIHQQKPLLDHTLHVSTHDRQSEHMQMRLAAWLYCLAR